MFPKQRKICVQNPRGKNKTPPYHHSPHGKRQIGWSTGYRQGFDKKGRAGKGGAQNTEGGTDRKLWYTGDAEEGPCVPARVGGVSTKKRGRRRICISKEGRAATPSHWNIPGYRGRGRAVCPGANQMP